MTSKNKGENGRKAVVVVDAAREVSLSLNPLHWALRTLPLQPSGDTILLLGLLQQVTTPMGYKIKVDTHSIVGVNKQVIEEAVARKHREFQDHVHIMEISKQLQAQQIKFDIDIRAGSSKIVAQRVSRKLDPTWLVLDRCLKNERKYFLESLSCSVFLMKKDNSTEELKGTRSVSAARRTRNVTYDEMMTEIDLGVVSLASPTTADEKKKAKECEIVGLAQPGVHIAVTASEREQLLRSDDPSFTNSICSICKNQRPKLACKRDFTYSELHAATQGFSPRNFLSEGGFGSVFRGDLSGTKIAVKQHKSVSFQGEKEFKSEVQVLSRVRHENLVMLLGSCSQGTHRMLVYEYVCNGSLDQHLSEHSREGLSWEKRMKIALGAAKGLQYLHANGIIHRDMRPNNILVTHDYQPLLGDFGLAKNQHDGSDHSADTMVVGTLGYVAPEYAEYGRVSSKTDVYSFGVVLLQLITGRKATDQKLGGKSLVGWARPRLKDRNYPELIDPRIQGSHDVHQLFWMVQVAHKCLCKNPNKRISMDEVIDALNHIMDTSTMVCGINNLSPAHSDSLSPESLGSPGDDTISFTLETDPSPSASGTSYAAEKLPPSPTTRPYSMSTTGYMYSPPILNPKHT